MSSPNGKEMRNELDALPLSYKGHRKLDFREGKQTNSLTHPDPISLRVTKHIIKGDVKVTLALGKTNEEQMAVKILF